MTRFVVVFAALAAIAAPSSAAASIWPTATHRLETELGAADPELRRRAAERLVGVRGPAGRALVERALGDPDVEVRLSALEAARALDLPDLGGRIAPWLSDPDARIRLAAAETLEAAPSSRALGALGRATSDTDPAVRGTVARALAASGSTEATLPLLGRLDDPVPDVRREVVVALGRLRDPRAVVPLLAKVEDTVAPVRRAVVRALGELGDARAVSALVLVLRDADETVRIAALEALGRLGDKAAAANVIGVLTSSSGATRRAAAGALARLGTPEARSALVAELVREQSDEDRAPLVAALLRAGSSAAATFRDCLAKSTPAAQVDGCASGLAEVGDTSDVARLREALERGRLTPSAALAALGGLGDSAALPIVLERVTDADPKTRAAAREALGELLVPERADGRAVDPLLRALGARRVSLGERAELSLLLGRTGSPRALEPLSALTGARSPAPLVAASLEGLGYLPVGSADGALLAGLDHEDGEVRRAAALSLRRAGSAQVTRALLGRLERAAEQDRTALGIALVGPVSRSRDGSLPARLASLVRATRGPERDVLLDALAASPLSEATAALSGFAKSPDPADRAKAAEGLAGRPAARAALLALARDREAKVRAAGAWSLGRVALPEDAAALTRLLADREVAVAANAAIALGRLGQRAKIAVTESLCSALGDSRAYVRANALAALARTGGRCGKGLVIELLLRDRTAVVRRAAARVLAAAPPGTPDQKALERCAADDADSVVAFACSAPAEPLPEEEEAVLVYVVPAGETEPAPGAAFVLRLADGSFRLGTTDRRGGVSERFAPKGPIELGIPGPLAE